MIIRQLLLPRIRVALDQTVKIRCFYSNNELSKLMRWQIRYSSRQARQMSGDIIIQTGTNVCTSNTVRCNKDIPPVLPHINLVLDLFGTVQVRDIPILEWVSRCRPVGNSSMRNAFNTPNLCLQHSGLLIVGLHTTSISNYVLMNWAIFCLSLEHGRSQLGEGWCTTTILCIVRWVYFV